MNIHEYQAKKILKDYKAPVLNGEVIFSLNEIDRKIKNLSTKKIVLKAQIHAGGRGKGGGIKIVNNIEELKTEAEKMLGSILITHQTGPKGKEVKRLYKVENNSLKPPTLEQQVHALRHREVETPEGIEILDPLLTEEHITLCNLLFSSKCAYVGKVETLTVSPMLYDDLYFLRTREKSELFDSKLDLNEVGIWPSSQMRGLTNENISDARSEIANSSANANFISREFSANFVDL